MLVIIDKFDSDNVTPMVLADDEWFVTHAFNGNDTLEFSFSDESGYFDLIEEESKILAIGLRGRSNRFVVKNIDSHDTVVTVNCDLDLYDWQKTIFDTYGGGSARTLEKVLQDVTPDGWSYSGQEQFGQSEVFQTGSREPVKAGTPLDVLDLASEVYGCVFNFDNIAKHLYVIDTESYTPTGDFLSDEVNLKSVGYVGNSEGYATRLYPYGKRDEDGENPVTIESVNDGISYVTNNEFSDDVICVGWSDERYTQPEHLKEAAIAKLAELASPTRSYECDVSQLNRNVWLYMVMTMIDRKHRTRVDQQVVEWKEYGRPDLDVVTLSAVAPSLESLLKSADGDDDAIYQYVNGVANDLTNAYKQAIEEATDKITGNDGGYFQWIFDSEGRPIELVNLGDSMDINSAKKIWRWNASGLGHSNNGINGPFDLAMLDDGSINANVITTGILQGGQSYWNLSTGDLSIIGTFNTRSDASMSGSSELYGVKVSPTFNQVETAGEDKMYGAGIQFTSGDGRAQNPYVASEMSTEQEALVSAVVVNSGRVAANDPGSWMRLGVRNDGGSNNLNKNAHAFVGSFSRYGSGGSSESAALDLESVQEVNGTPVGEVSARLYAKTSSGQVGMYAIGRTSSGAISERLYLGGLLTAMSTIGTFMVLWWAKQNITSYTVSTYTATTDSPARRGKYRAFASVSMTMTASDMHGIICTVGKDSASGWSIHLFTLPNFINAKINTGDAWNAYKFWNGTNKAFELNTFGMLIAT